MGAKELFILILGLLAGLRLGRPKIFALWIRGEFKALGEENWGFFTLFLYWSTTAVFGAITLSALPVGPLWMILGIPGLLFWRSLWAALISNSFKSRPGLFWSNFDLPSVGAMSLVYLSLALAVQFSIILNQDISFITGLVMIGHTAGLIFYGINHNAIVRIADSRIRVYSILYLCALEIIPLHLFYTAHINV
ncbi:MAG: hypothetical protein RL754_879 [Bacteroidota bacterium]|jgi:hypothetical protein